ncbi:tetratricopeptide repeat protein [Sphingomonas sabuli]|uniref:Tetratricopeptide repeat protein n=2 Tax=Sphingomonas sabuli TaxID=2764186 RepID=A0A7G9L4P1_9SPHN|nr:tetratricopeptide repeat protein [Sphingomonas sabuli]
MENGMKISVRFLALGAAAVMLASPVVGQRPDNQILPQSITLQQQGEALFSAGKLTEAADILETALAVDPRNRAAFVDLARVAKQQKLFGKAIRLTNEALQLEPNDVTALEVQGEAMVELGALPRARQNLAKIQQLCASGCRQVTDLTAAINRGPTVASATTPEVTKKN